MTIATGIFGTPKLFTMQQAVQHAPAADVPFPSRLGTPADWSKVELADTNVTHHKAVWSATPEDPGRCASLLAPRSDNCCKRARM